LNGRARLDDVFQVQRRIENRADETAAAAVLQTQIPRHRGLPEVGVHDQHARLRCLSDRAREIDRGQGLAVAGPRAGHGHDREIGGLVQVLHAELQRPILLGSERGRRQETHQVRIDLRCGRRHDVADRGPRRQDLFLAFLVLLSLEHRRRSRRSFDDRSDCRLGWRRQSRNARCRIAATGGAP
jgi:hypothetical protein